MTARQCDYLQLVKDTTELIYLDDYRQNEGTRLHILTNLGVHIELLRELLGEVRRAFGDTDHLTISLAVAVAGLARDREMLRAL